MTHPNLKAIEGSYVEQAAKSSVNSRIAKLQQEMTAVQARASKQRAAAKARYDAALKRIKERADSATEILRARVAAVRKS